LQGSESALMHHFNDVVNLVEAHDSLLGPRVQVFLEMCHIKKVRNERHAISLLKVAFPVSCAPRFVTSPKLGGWIVEGHRALTGPKLAYDYR